MCYLEVGYVVSSPGSIASSFTQKTIHLVIHSKQDLSSIYYESDTLLGIRKGCVDDEPKLNDFII